MVYNETKAFYLKINDIIYIFDYYYKIILVFILPTKVY